MANFAVIEGENVVNTIIAESLSIAEEITGKTCIEFTSEPAETGGTYVNGIFIPRKPYPSWILNSNNAWEPPVAYPEIDNNNPKAYAWNEETTSWVEVQ